MKMVNLIMSNLYFFYILPGFKSEYHFNLIPHHKKIEKSDIIPADIP